jgi:predicted DNA-binding transcriptional regulator YafY
MPVNRNALIRYKTIDKCLQNHYRQWTLEDLIEACSEALYEYEGITKGISKRTIQLDIQIMRSDKLGYNAPIIVYDNKYYEYEDRDYSITNIPLTDKDLGKLTEAVEFMKQFKGFSHFRELEGMIQKLEDHVYSQKRRQKPVIDFEKNENLKGLEHLDVLYKSIIQQRSVTLTYQSFKARQASSFIFHPYLLKEFRNRWFLIGIKSRKEPILTLALDRILEIHPSDAAYVSMEDFKADEYFKDVIGVTVSPELTPEKVILFVTHKHAGYVITKPLHPSQKVIDKDCHGVTIELAVQLNFELEKEILGLGEGVMVISPERLKRSISNRLNDAIDLYNTSITGKGIITISRKLENKGFAVVNNLYTKRALHQIESNLLRVQKADRQEKAEIVIDPEAFPVLKACLVNRNIEKITGQFSGAIEVKEAIFYQYLPEELFNWKQPDEESAFSLVFFLEHPRISAFPVQLLPGSHQRKLNPAEQLLITENSSPSEVNLSPGAGILFKPLLIRRFHEVLKDKKARCIEMKFQIPNSKFQTNSKP